MITLANVSDVKLLTEVALLSKAYWGYSNEFIESWKSDLTITEKMISECAIFKFLVDDTIVGFYVLNLPKQTSIELEMLFVLPQFIGKGIGSQLIFHAFQKAKEQKLKTMTLLADPNAVPFYESKNFYKIDKKESSIPNRFLPVMKKDLEY